MGSSSSKPSDSNKTTSSSLDLSSNAATATASTDNTTTISNNIDGVSACPVKRQQQKKSETSSTASATTTTTTTTNNTQTETDKTPSSMSSSGGGSCPMKKWGRSKGAVVAPSSSSSSSSSYACPVKHQHQQSTTTTTTTTSTTATTTAMAATGAAANETASSPCPVGRQTQTQYNVYGQPIDPSNQMSTDAIANQLPAPTQTIPLPTERVQSTIPKGGAQDGTTWTYPSPQMFYNALVRKQKLDNNNHDSGNDNNNNANAQDEEATMESVVALHNNMNERTWAKVLEWEDVTCNGAEPKLLKFMGRPTDLSPKAAFKHYVLGHPLPFDRHDWTVVRNDGTHVRYVIDYYHDESRAQEDDTTGFPNLHDFDATPSLLVDVRPALDSPRAFVGRMISMPYARYVSQSTTFVPMPVMPTAELKSQVKESIDVWQSIQQQSKQKRQQLLQQEDATTNTIVEQPKVTTVSSSSSSSNLSEEEAIGIAKSFGQVLKDCQKAQQKVSDCTTEQECARASMDLTLCMAKLWCPLQHSAVVDALQRSTSKTTTTTTACSSEVDDENDVRVEKALENVSACVASASQRTQHARRKYPQVFSKEHQQQQQGA